MLENENINEPQSPAFLVGAVSGSALGDLQLLRDAIQVAQYLAWDMKLDSVGGKKALEIMNELHNGKYGSGEGIWVQTGKALEALEKHFRYQLGKYESEHGREDK